MLKVGAWAETLLVALTLIGCEAKSNKAETSSPLAVQSPVTSPGEVKTAELRTAVKSQNTSNIPPVRSEEDCAHSALAAWLPISSAGGEAMGVHGAELKAALDACKAYPKTMPHLSPAEITNLQTCINATQAVIRDCSAGNDDRCTLVVAEACEFATPKDDTPSFVAAFLIRTHALQSSDYASCVHGIDTQESLDYKEFMKNAYPNGSYDKEYDDSHQYLESEPLPRVLVTDVCKLRFQSLTEIVNSTAWKDYGPGQPGVVRIAYPPRPTA